MGCKVVSLRKVTVWPKADTEHIATMNVSIRFIELNIVQEVLSEATFELT